MNTEQLLGRLDADIEQDARKMARWRQIHRVVATSVTLMLIVLPVLTAMKLLGDGSVQTYALFVLTVLAAFDGIFKPAAYSARRRADAADMTDLLWQYRGAVVAVGSDPAKQLAVHNRYRSQYQRLYRERGQYLVDYGLAQRDNDRSRKTDPVETAVLTAPAGAPADGAATTAAAKSGTPSNGDVAAGNP